MKVPSFPSPLRLRGQGKMWWRGGHLCLPAQRGLSLPSSKVASKILWRKMAQFRHLTLPVHTDAVTSKASRPRWLAKCYLFIYSRECFFCPLCPPPCFAFLTCGVHGVSCSCVARLERRLHLRSWPTRSTIFGSNFWSKIEGRAATNANRSQRPPTRLAAHWLTGDVCSAVFQQLASCTAFTLAGGVSAASL